MYYTYTPFFYKIRILILDFHLKFYAHFLCHLLILWNIFNDRMIYIININH